MLGVPVGFFTSVYLAKIASPKVRGVIETAVSLLAGIPSVVYGLVGMLILVPGIRKLFNVPDGASLLAAIIVLAIMILPSIIKVSLNALEAVPKEYEDASLALGATDIETYFKVSVPAARSGIAAAVVLGVGRAIGEAMAVMMVSGNVPNMPSLFQSVRFLTTAVASEMSYSAGLQRQALFSIALVLFLFIMLINVVLNLFFVIVCDLSVVGVALASAISQCVSAFLILRALTRVQDCYALDPHKLQLDPVQAKSILALGVPAGLQNAIFAIANLFIQAGVNSFDSLMVKGNSAAANADGLIYDCMAAFYMACASFMSQNYGAGRPDRVKKSYFISLGYSFGVGLVLGAALFFCGPSFLALFTTETAVIDAGMKRVAVMAFAYGISAFMDCTIAASRGLGKTVVPTVIVVLGSCVFRVIWVYSIFAHFHTIPSLYLLYPCSWALTAIAEILYFIRCYKQAMKIFREPIPSSL